MKKIILLISIITILIANDTFAQKDTVKIDGMIYSFVPQYLINRGIRLDIEKQITPRSFIQICPQFYLGERNDYSSSDINYDDYYYYDENEFNKVTGGGLNVYHKVFANTNFLKNGIYFSYGLSYNYFEIEYYENYLDAIINAKGKIKKYGGDLLIGYQFLFRHKLSLDLYTGVGTRFSNMNTNGESKDRFNSSYFGYNYTGNIMHIGFRIGLIL